MQLQFPSWRILGAAVIALAILVVVATWPLVPSLASAISPHPDPYFSMWRLGWIAHAIRTGQSLFDANIFYPTKATLAYSDATLIQGLLATPFIVVGVPLPLVYNASLLLGVLLSGLAMFVLCFGLTKHYGASLIGATIFAFSPFRMDHMMHLELQWCVGVPLALYWTHRLLKYGRPLDALLLSGALLFQLGTCVYYGAFLVVFSLLALPLFLLCLPNHRDVKGLGWWVVAVALFGALATPYLIPYARNARILGPRDPAEVLQYSATVAGYFASPSQNYLYGWTADFGSPENRVFMGILPLVLGLCAFIRRDNIRTAGVYSLLAGLSALLSLGLHSFLYRLLLQLLPILQGFRAPARFGIFALFCVAIVASLGVTALLDCIRLKGGRILLQLCLVTILLGEYWSVPLSLTRIAATSPDVYRVLASMPKSVVLELPVPAPNRLPGFDAEYEYWSTSHWHQLVNGYSGFYPDQYLETLETLRSFPNAASLARLKKLNVNYIVIHNKLYDQKALEGLLIGISRYGELKYAGIFKDSFGNATLFEVVRNE